MVVDTKFSNTKRTPFGSFGDDPGITLSNTIPAPPVWSGKSSAHGRNPTCREGRVLVQTLSPQMGQRALSRGACTRFPVFFVGGGGSGGLLKTT